MSINQKHFLDTKQRIAHLRSFWRLDIMDLNFSLSTASVANRLQLRKVYDLHRFLLTNKRSLFSSQQQKEIRQMYQQFGFFSPLP